MYKEYEVVYTKSDKAVLDIGLKDEDGVIGRWSDYCKHTPRYSTKGHWCHSGIFMSKRRWEKISLNMGTDENQCWHGAGRFAGHGRRRY